VVNLIIDKLDDLWLKVRLKERQGITTLSHLLFLVSSERFVGGISPVCRWHGMFDEIFG
jgi:hypothetical protein